MATRFESQEGSFISISQTRSSFVINYTLTLIAVAILLTNALATLKAQDSSSLSGGSRRVPLSLDISANEPKRTQVPSTGQHQSAGSVHSMDKKAHDKSLDANKKQESGDDALSRLLSNATSNLNSSSRYGRGQVDSNPPPIGNDFVSRQTRATTKKKSQSTTASPSSSTDADTTTIQPSTSSYSATQSATDDDSDAPSTPMKVERKNRRRKNKRPQEVADEEEEDEESEEDRERARRRRWRRKHKSNTTSTTISPKENNPLNETSSTVPESTSAKPKQTKNTPIINLDDSPQAGILDKEGRPVTVSRRRAIQNSSTTSSTTTTTAPTFINPLELKKANSSYNKLSNATSLDHELFDNEEEASTKKQIDFSKVKPIDLKQWNETIAISKTTSATTPKSGIDSQHLTLSCVPFNLNQNTSMTMPSPKPLNVSSDQSAKSTAWSSTRDLSSVIPAQKAEALPQKAGDNSSTPMNTTESLPSKTITTSSINNTTKTTTSTLGSNTSSDKIGYDNAKESNRSIIDIMKDMNEEHSKIDGNVKEQANSLRHFIVICSVSVVLATSLAVALIVLLFKK